MDVSSHRIPPDPGVRKKGCHMKSLLFVAAAAAGLSLVAGQALADDDFVPKAKGRWIVDLRATDVAPAHKSAIRSGGVPTGLDAKVTDSVVPTVGISYFFTDHIAVEVIAGTSHHAVKAVGPTVDEVVHKTWVLPPVISAQYHFLPKGRFSPYVGTGPAIMVFYSGENVNGFSTKLPNGVGWAAQTGLDVALKGHWHLNADLKKVWYETDAKIDNGALTSKVNLDPWVSSVGVGYRF
jgi:outer membrane protein